MHGHGATTTVVSTGVDGSTGQSERLREHLPRYGGTLLRGGAGGHLLAFPSARGALRWAVDVRRALGDAGPQLRIGMHVGEPAFHGDELHGRTVVKAARIARLARGGEVLASRLVRELAEGDEPLGDGVWFGEERDVELSGLRGRHAIVPLRWQAAPRVDGLDELTEREREVLGLIAE